MITVLHELEFPHATKDNGIGITGVFRWVNNAIAPFVCIGSVHDKYLKLA